MRSNFDGYRPRVADQISISQQKQRLRERLKSDLMSLKRLVVLRDVAALLAKSNASGVHGSYACAAYTPSTKQRSQAPWGAATAAVVGLACWLYAAEQPARCLIRQPELHENVTECSDGRPLQCWLASVGASVEAIEIRDSQVVKSLLGHLPLVLRPWTHTLYSVAAYTGRPGCFRF